MLSNSFHDKLNLFFKKYISENNKEYREELNRVRNNVMHKGIAAPKKLKRDEDKDKFYSLKDESKYYFFKFRELFVQVFLSELEWKGEHYSYSCSKDGIVERVEVRR